MTSDEIKQHERDLTLTLHEEVPAHKPREDSETKYRENREKVMEEDDGSCWCCGRTPDELPDGVNMEAHHCPVEFSLWPAADPDKMQEVFDSGKIDWHGFSEKLKGEPVTSVHDPRNMMRLCSECHREDPADKGHYTGGAHNMTMALWFFQLVMEDGYDLFKQG